MAFKSIPLRKFFSQKICLQKKKYVKKVWPSVTGAVLQKPSSILPGYLSLFLQIFKLPSLPNHKS